MRVAAMGLVGALGLLAPLGAWGEEPVRAKPAPRAPALAVVDFQRVLALSRRGEQARLRLKDAIVRRQQEIERLQEELEGLERDYRAKEGALPAEEWEAYQARFGARVRELRRRGEDVREELADQERRLTEQLAREVQELVRLYARKHGLALVVEGSVKPPAYLDPAADLTQTILDLYDAQPPREEPK